MSKIIVRAWNSEGYHRDIMMMNEQQVLMKDVRVSEANVHPMAAPFGAKATIFPKEFPEMESFEIIVVEEPKR